MTGSIDFSIVLRLGAPDREFRCGDTYGSIVMSDGLPPPSLESLEAAWAAYVPPKSWTPYEFRKLFTDAELTAFLVAAKSNTAIDLMRFKLTTADALLSDDPNVIAALNALEQAASSPRPRRGDPRDVSLTPPAGQ